MNPLDAGYTVEPGVEHHSGMHRVAAGNPLMCGETIAGPVRVGESYARNHGTNPGKQVVDVPGKIAPSERV